MSAKTDPIFRFMEKVEITPTCWIWHGAISSTGYGNFGMWPDTVSAHVFSFETFVGPVPDGMDVDHQCHNLDLDCRGGRCVHRRCVNPDDLLSATRRENTLRGRGPSALNAVKTECLRGHDFTPENTYTDRHGKRSCLTCRKMLWQRFAAKRKAMAA